MLFPFLKHLEESVRTFSFEARHFLSVNQQIKCQACFALDAFAVASGQQLVTGDRVGKTLYPAAQGSIPDQTVEKSNFVSPKIGVHLTTRAQLTY